MRQQAAGVICQASSLGSKVMYPCRDTHRGRLSGEWAADERGDRYRRIILRLKPTKTDPTGEEGWVKTFRLDSSPDYA